MPLLTPTASKTTKNFRISLDENLVKQIDNYCQYAHIQGLDAFIEKAAEFVFSKDKEWRELGAQTAQLNTPMQPNEAQ